MVVLLQGLHHGRKVQTLEPPNLDGVVLQTPLAGLQRDDKVDVLEQARDGVGLGAVRIRHAPQDIGGRQAVSLDRQSETHLGRVASRKSNSERRSDSTVTSRRNF